MIENNFPPPKSLDISKEQYPEAVCFSTFYKAYHLAFSWWSRNQQPEVLQAQYAGIVHMV